MPSEKMKLHNETPSKKQKLLDDSGCIAGGSGELMSYDNRHEAVGFELTGHGHDYQDQQLKSKQKAEGLEKGGPGVDYQVLLTMYFARQGYELSQRQPNYNFELGKEMMEAGKFDDIVFRYTENMNSKWNYLLLQSKYSEKIARITTGMLLSADNNGPFTLLKYFSSFIKSKEKFGKHTDFRRLESCVIVTNVDFDYDEASDNKLKPASRRNAGTGRRGESFYLESCTPNQILTVEGTQAKYLKFHSGHKDEIIKELITEFKISYTNTCNKILKKQTVKGEAAQSNENISKAAKSVVIEREDTNSDIIKYMKTLILDDEKLTEHLEDFLDKLVFLVNLPKREDIRHIIKDKIGAEFLLLNESIVDQFNREMFDYTTSKHRKEFFAGKDIENFFNKMKQVINTLNLKTDYFLKIQDSVCVVDFKKEIKQKIALADFLSSSDTDKKDIFLLKTDSTFLTALKIYSMLPETGLTQYTYSDAHLFLSFKEFNSSTWNEKVISSFGDQNGINLLVIVFSDQHSSCSQHLLTGLCSELKRKQRLVLITSKGFKLDSENDEIFNAMINPFEDNNINFCDLTDSSKETLLSKRVNFQGNDLILRHFFCKAGQEMQAEEWKQIRIGIQTLSAIVQSNLIEIKKPLSISDLEGSYTKFYEEMKNEVLVENLLFSGNFFIISGISEEILLNSLVSNHNEGRMNNIKIKISDSKIMIKNENFEEEHFKEICHKEPDKEIYWIDYENNSFILRHYYNPKFYLDRKFYYPDKVIINHNIKKELLEDNLCNFFLFTGTDRVEDLVEILNLDDHQTETFKQNIRNIKIIISKENGSEKFIKLKKANNESVHWLHVENEKESKIIVWIESFRSLANLRNYTEVEEILIDSDEQLIDNLKDKKANLIIDKPGMGKSTTLVSVSQKLIASYWIMHINLRDCKKAIDNLPMDVNYVDIVLNFLSDTKKIENSLEKDLARYKLEHDGGDKPLKLLFDGFDEIKSDNADNIEKTKVISLLKYLTEHTQATIWVTARQHDAPVLQDSLSVFCIKFEAFSPLMQKQYFRDVWKTYLKTGFSQKELNKAFLFVSDGKQNKFEEYYMTLSETINKVLQEKNSNFMGIPLTLRLFAETFREKFKKFVECGHDFSSDFDDLSIFSLYQHFIDEKFEIFLKEKTRLSERFNKISKGWFKEQIIKKHQRLAFHELFSDRVTVKLLGIKSPFLVEEQSLMINGAELEELLRLGLVQSIQNDHFEFIHRTFSEYFVAKLFRYILKNKKRSNPDKYNQIYEFIDKEIFKEQHAVIFKFIDAMAQKEKQNDWTNKWELILSIRNDNLLGTETDRNEIVWNAQLSSQESFANLKKKVKMLLESFNDSHSYYKKHREADCKVVKNLFEKFITEIDVDELKSALELWLTVINRLSNVNKGIDANIFFATQHYVAQAKQQNREADLEFIKNHFALAENSFESNAATTIAKYKNKDINDLTEKELIDEVIEIYKQNNNLQWLERDGLDIVKSLKLLTLDMSKIFNSIIGNVDEPYGFHDVYASRVYDYLVLPLLDFFSCDEIVKNAHVEKAAILNIFQCISHFCSDRGGRLQLSENELKSLLNCIQNVMQRGKVSPQNLFHGIESLRALRSWNFRLTCRNDKLLLTNGKEFVHKLALNYDVTKIESLLLFRQKNAENEAFLEECKKVSTSIIESEI